MTDTESLLYKVSEPGRGTTLAPRVFWHSEDWSFSDDHPHDGLIEDCVLYAAPFDEINIHLLPSVWRLRVWLDEDARRDRLRAMGYTWPEGLRAVIFTSSENEALIQQFVPTVYAFDRAGFEEIPTGEFITRTAQTAVAIEEIPLPIALRRWHVEVIYVSDTVAFAQRLRDGGVDHQIQA